MTIRTSKLLFTTALTTAFTGAMLIASPAAASEGDDGQDTSSSGDQTSSGTDTGQSSSRIVPNAGTIRSFFGPATGSAGTIRSFAGMIRSFEGEAGPDAGTIRSFAGNIQQHAGTIRSFESEIYTSQETTAAFWGKAAPNAGTIRSFAGEFEGLAGTIRSFAGTIRSFADPSDGYAELTAHIAALVEQSRAQYGTAVKQRTGESFDDAITNKLLAKYGIDLNDPATANLNELGIELFLLDWYDNVNAYSGADSVDSWMKQINWSPALTETLGSGFDSKIGLLDFMVTGDEADNIVKSDGISEVAGGHGSAVASLIVGAHDGFGAMGIAPGASVVSYNPFDETNTAGWDDIRDGVIFLTKNKASVINLSLGVPGWTLHEGWNKVFSNGDVSKEAKERVFVLSAGNDGIVQTADVEWDFKKNPSIIVVGSVDPNNVISAFSNQPGTVCLVQGGECKSDADRLMNRYIVAPGEFILVSDGQGGVTRMSGTSFAAPLVSGTIALIHDRWPWLAKQSEASSEIVLSTARDLGAKGTDPIYGRGLLDVQAALSPVNWGNLKWKVSFDGNKPSDVKAGVLTDDLSKLRTTWEAKGAYVVLFDNIEVAGQKSKGSEYRDFAIPLSSKLAGQTLGKSEDQFMAYLQNRFWEWIATQGQTASSGTGGKKFGFAGSSDVVLGDPGEWRTTLSMGPRIGALSLGESQRGMEMMLAMQSPGQQFGFAFGQGNGARNLAGRTGFGLSSDHAIDTGGVNPLLSFASGGAFGNFSYALSDTLDMEIAFSQQDEERDLDGFGLAARQDLGRLEPYRASATLMTLGYQAADGLKATLSYTLLDEQSGLLGMQSLDDSDLRNGTRTDAVTLGADMQLSPTFAVSASGTLGRTRQGNLDSQNIAVSSGGLINSAFQVAVTKTGLAHKSDVVRLSLAQPLHIESGMIDINSTEVIDRLTGDLGNVVQTVGLDSGERQFVAEAMYGRSFMDGTASMNIFGRTMLNGSALRSNQSSVSVGASFKLAF